LQRYRDWKIRFCGKDSIPLIETVSLLYINLACLSWCLSVCLYPINVKTAEPIGPKFFVWHHVTTGKVYEWSKFQIFVSIKIRSSLNFWTFWKSTKFFVKIRGLFLFCFTIYTKSPPPPEGFLCRVYVSRKRVIKKYPHIEGYILAFVILEKRYKRILV